MVAWKSRTWAKALPVLNARGRGMGPTWYIITLSSGAHFRNSRPQATIVLSGTTTRNGPYNRYLPCLCVGQLK